MSLTYEVYEQLGGICPRQLFERCRMEAESTLAQLNSVYNIVWNSPEAQNLAMIALVDESFNIDTAIQSGGGEVTSIRVGSYSETRQNGSSASAVNSLGRSKAIISRYARLFAKPLGVLR